MRHWPPASASLPGPLADRTSRAPRMTRTQISRLVPMSDAERGDLSPPGRRAVIGRLVRALRAERRRGISGHWTYDLNRHLALKQALASERAGLTCPCRTGEYP